MLGNDLFFLLCNDDTQGKVVAVHPDQLSRGLGCGTRNEVLEQGWALGLSGATLSRNAAGSLTSRKSCYTSPIIVCAPTRGESASAQASTWLADGNRHLVAPIHIVICYVIEA